MRLKLLRRLCWFGQGAVPRTLTLHTVAAYHFDEDIAYGVLYLASMNCYI